MSESFLLYLPATRLDQIWKNPFGLASVFRIIGKMLAQILFLDANAISNIEGDDQSNDHRDRGEMAKNT